MEPYLDRDGRFCALGQDGPSRFLAGTDGSFDALRECEVPVGKHTIVVGANYEAPEGGFHRMVQNFESSLPSARCCCG